MISRYFVIALALGVGVMQVVHHAWIEAIGLFGLSIGLTLLRVAQVRGDERIRRIAWICLLAPVAAFIFLLKRDYLR